MSPRMIWSPEMVHALRTYRAEGVPLFVCAEAIGVGYATCVYKARELDLSDRMNRGRKTGAAILEQRKRKAQP